MPTNANPNIYVMLYSVYFSLGAAIERGGEKGGEKGRQRGVAAPTEIRGLVLYHLVTGLLQVAYYVMIQYHSW